jgi:very-short-patch-repair endonuclease
LKEQNENKAKHRIYKSSIKQLARSNRSNPTEAERKLWCEIRDKLSKFKFRKQFPIDNKHIVDFICLERRLIIEVDGSQHSESKEDIERTKYLDKQVFKVIRFWNSEVLNNISVCLEVIYEKLNR